MLERKLRIYFGYYPTTWILIVVISLMVFLLSMWIAPGGSLPDGMRSKMHSIFADLLGMDKLRLEGWMNFSIIFFGRLLPLIFLFLGGIELWRYLQDRPPSDREADTLIGQALANLPSRAAARIGLPSDLQGYESLILWGPRGEDFTASQELIPPHEPQRTAQGRFRVGSDGLGRYARYDVLVLLRDQSHLYLLDGFVDITTAQISGERTGDYLLSDVAKHLPDVNPLPPKPLNTRVGLRFKDGWQYEVDLLGEREARRVFSPAEAPVIAFPQAVERLQAFCPVQQADAPSGEPAQLPAPAARAQLLAGAARVVTPARMPFPVPALVGRLGRAIPLFRRSAEDREAGDLYRDLQTKARGDREMVERWIDFERQRRPGHTRVYYMREAKRRWEADNR